MRAVILAGGRRKVFEMPAAEKFINQTSPVLVARTLTLSRFVDEAVIVTSNPIEDVEKDTRIIEISDEAPVGETVKRGLENYEGNSKYALFATADIPLITKKSIDDFIEKAQLLRADIVYPIIPENSVKSRFSGTSRTYITLADGKFTGGNVFLVNRFVVDGLIETVNYIFDLRKSPIKLVKILGFMFLVKLLLRRLTIAEVESKCSAILELNCKALVTEHAELGVDVDKESDLELVVNELSIT